MTLYTQEGAREVLASWELLHLAEGPHLLLILEDVSEKRALAQELREAGIRLAEKREQLNLTLARDVHDTVIQQLIGTGYVLEAEQKELAKQVTGEAAEALEKALTTARERVMGAAITLRGLISELRPPGLLEFGLRESLRNYVKQLTLEAEAQGGDPLVIILHADDGDGKLSYQAALALYRIAQEALRNVQRHAKAGRAEVTLRFTDGEAQLTIRDDGAGFTVPERLSLLTYTDHFGLIGLEEQMSALGGKLTVRSAPGEGSEITAAIPLSSETESTGRGDS